MPRFSHYYLERNVDQWLKSNFGAFPVISLRAQLGPKFVTEWATLLHTSVDTQSPDILTPHVIVETQRAGVGAFAVERNQWRTDDARCVAWKHNLIRGALHNSRDKYLYGAAYRLSQKSVSSFCMSTQTFYLFLVAIHRLKIQKMSLSVTDVFVKNRNQIQMG